MIKRNVYIMYAIAILQGMVFYAPVATLYRQACNISIFEITIIESLSFTIMILLEIPWGYIAEKIGYKRVLIINCFLYFTSKVIFWKADGFLWFLLERVLLGIVCAGLSGIDSAILYLSSDKENSQKVFGIYSAFSRAGLVIAAGVFAVFIKENYRLSAFLTVISYMMSALLSLFLVEVKGKTEERTTLSKALNALKKSLINRSLLLVLLASVLLSESCQILTVFLNQPKYVSVGLTPPLISMAYIIVAMSGLSSALTHFFTKKTGNKLFGTLMFAFSGISCAVLAVSTSWVICVLLMVVLSMCSSMFEPICSEMQNVEVKTENRATVLSMNSVLMSSGAVFINLIYGKIADININSAFMLGAFLCLVGAIMYILNFCLRNKR